MPLGATSITRMASAPSTIRYQVPYSASQPRSTSRITAPMIGPSIVPMPPITTMNSTKAVQSITENADCGVIEADWKKISPPASDAPAAAST